MTESFRRLPVMEVGIPRFILITGCSGAGKSTLLSALRSAGHAVVPEPGRRIVAEEIASGGAALPWIDPAAFARRAVAMSRSDLISAGAAHGFVFFDRGLIDAAVALCHIRGIPIEDTLGGLKPYADPVFLAPPWPELYENDEERRHGFAEALQEFARLEAALFRLNYEVRQLPKAPVGERLDFVLNSLSR
ncbi:MAG: AAA family ATPase [Tabrizicola sp.]